jgi:hypothetical protein
MGARAGLAAEILVASVTFAGSGVGKQIAARTADEYPALPPGQRERTAMTGES